MQHFLFALSVFFTVSSASADESVLYYTPGQTSFLKLTCPSGVCYVTLEDLKKLSVADGGSGSPINVGRELEIPTNEVVEHGNFTALSPPTAEEIVSHCTHLPGTVYSLMPVFGGAVGYLFSVIKYPDHYNARKGRMRYGHDVPFMAAGAAVGMVVSGIVYAVIDYKVSH